MSSSSQTPIPTKHINIGSRLDFYRDLGKIYSSFAIQYISYCFKLLKNRQFGTFHQLLSNKRRNYRVVQSLKQLFRRSFNLGGLYHNFLNEYAHVWHCLLYVRQYRVQSKDMIETYLSKMMTLKQSNVEYNNQIAALTQQNIIFHDEALYYKTQVETLKTQNTLYSSQIAALTQQHIVLKSQITLLADELKNNPNYKPVFMQANVTAPMVEINPQMAAYIQAHGFPENMVFK